MSEWQPIETAPKDGTRFQGKARMSVRVQQMPGSILPGSRMADVRRVTRWCKVSHVPLYGWCHGRGEDVDLWEPTHWKPLAPKKDEAYYETPLHSYATRPSTRSRMKQPK